MDLARRLGVIDPTALCAGDDHRVGSRLASKSTVEFFAAKHLAIIAGECTCFTICSRPLRCTCADVINKLKLVVDGKMRSELRVMLLFALQLLHPEHPRFSAALLQHFGSQCSASIADALRTTVDGVNRATVEMEPLSEDAFREISVRTGIDVAANLSAYHPQAKALFLEYLPQSPRRWRLCGDRFPPPHLLWSVVHCGQHDALATLRWICDQFDGTHLDGMDFAHEMQKALIYAIENSPKRDLCDTELYLKQERKISLNLALAVDLNAETVVKMALDDIVTNNVTATFGGGAALRRCLEKKLWRSLQGVTGSTWWTESDANRRVVVPSDADNDCVGELHRLTGASTVTFEKGNKATDEGFKRWAKRLPRELPPERHNNPLSLSWPSVQRGRDPRFCGCSSSCMSVDLSETIVTPGFIAGGYFPAWVCLRYVKSVQVDRTMNNGHLVNLARLWAVPAFVLRDCINVTGGELKTLLEGNSQGTIELIDVTGCSVQMTPRALRDVDEKIALVASTTWTCDVVDDEDLAAVARLQHLEKLTVRLAKRCQITDAGIARLVSLTTLTSLSIASCKQLTDDALRTVTSAMPGLTELDVAHCDQLTDEAMGAIGRIGALTTVDISDCQRITVQGFMALHDEVVVRAEGTWRLTDVGTNALERILRLRCVSQLHLDLAVGISAVSVLPRFRFGTCDVARMLERLTLIQRAHVETPRHDEHLAPAAANSSDDCRSPLTSFVLRAHQVDADFLGRVRDWFPSLQHLDVSGCGLARPLGYKALHNLAALKTLHLGNCVFAQRRPDWLVGNDWSIVSSDDLRGFRPSVEFLVATPGAEADLTAELQCDDVCDADIEWMVRLQGVTKWTIRDSPNLTGDSWHQWITLRNFAAYVSPVRFRSCGGLSPGAFSSLTHFMSLSELYLEDCPNFDDRCAQEVAQCNNLTRFDVVCRRLRRSYNGGTAGSASEADRYYRDHVKVPSK